MIISYSNNFSVIRAPKTGSTSLVFYFFKSGLIDPEKDTYSIEGPFSTWEEFEAYDKKHGLDYSQLPQTLYGPNSLKDVHRTFDDLRAKGAVQADMPCVGGIRNPLEWLASLFYYIKVRRAVTIADNNGLMTRGTIHSATNYGNPNSYWDYIKNNWDIAPIQYSVKPQSSYFPDHAELFNTENLHEHVSKYILERGGSVDGRIEMRKNPDNKLDVFLAELTPDRKQDILDTYAHDFELWEKAYAVYN
jgi:hypothetical protein